MRAYSLDLRQRVVEALQSGQRHKALAQRFDISLASVQRYARAWRERGHLAARPIPGRARALCPEQAQELEELLRSRTDWTLQSLAQAWQQQTGRGISVSALHRNLRWQDGTHKKRVG